MAFEAYLQQDVRPRGGRRIMYTLSVALHVAAVLAAIAYSFWHVEELSPPRVTVTLLSAAAAPPPPPPPPPLGGGAPTPRHKPVVRPRVETPKVTEIVQPKVEEKEQPKETPREVTKEDVKPPIADAPPGPGTADGVKGGVAGGVKGGVVGGTVGGTIGGTGTAPAPVAAKFLPPHMAAQQRISGAEPDFPAHLRRAGANYLVMVKIVVGVSGAVESVTLQKRADPTLDGIVVATVKTWRFRPLMANGTPVPFSYFGRFEFKSE